MDRKTLEGKSVSELKEVASALELKGVGRLKKADLVSRILDAADDGDGDEDKSGSQNGGRQRTRARKRSRSSGSQSKDDKYADAEVREGVLDLLPEGYGFLRTTGYLSGEKDVYVSQSWVRRFSLRRGDRVRGPIRSNNRGSDKYPALARVDAIEGLTVDEHLDRDRGNFAELTVVSPHDRLVVDGGEAARLVNHLAPLGLGQRGVISGPPRSGRTHLLRELVQEIESADDAPTVMTVLVDARPEEVTEFVQAIDGEVISTTLDNQPEDHVQLAELAIERAKRLVEVGEHVVLAVDSLTRLARAWNHTTNSGRQLLGGVDAAALHPLKRFLGAARTIEDGGSLTILATTTVDSGSITDEVLYEEIEAAVNMEVRLDAELARVRRHPAVAVLETGTRREDLLLADDEAKALDELREEVTELDAEAALDAVQARLA